MVKKHEGIKNWKNSIKTGANRWKRSIPSPSYCKSLVRFTSIKEREQNTLQVKFHFKAKIIFFIPSEKIPSFFPDAIPVDWNKKIWGPLLGPLDTPQKVQKHLFFTLIFLNSSSDVSKPSKMSRWFTNYVF